MLISVNPKPDLSEFRNLMRKTDTYLNQDAVKRPDYYKTRNGNPLEDDVLIALRDSSKGTPFFGTIEKISGQKFPDIVAAKLYGVEVKSTKDDHWTSTGSSILESTRVSGIERIYMTFGKLGGKPPQFISKPYEECLYDIAVTHMPRYLINMQIKPEETIFEKMKLPYDKLRTMENPVEPVADYYKSLLKPGERLWWTGNPAEEVVAPALRLWKNIKTAEKRFYTVYGLVNFPEVFIGDYDRYAVWLTSTQSIVDPHIRDQFSAGGKEEIVFSDGEKVLFPAVFRKVKENIELIIKRFGQENTDDLQSPSNAPIGIIEKRWDDWSRKVASVLSNKCEYEKSVKALRLILMRYLRQSKSSPISVITKRVPLYNGEKIVKCKYCGKYYAQLEKPQTPGLRFSEDDYCPYCHKSNGESLEWEFINRRLD